MTISILGINHRTAPVELRERVAFGPVQLEQALTELKQLPGIEEAIIVSTCNRTELYCHGHAEHQPMLHWLSQFHGITPSELEQHHYYHIQEDAVAHLMSVASGLDSLVLGEPQILGQVKQAYQQAKHFNVVGGILERLFQNTFRVAKAVRNETEVGQNAVSVAFAAVSLAKHIFGDLKHSNVLLVGAGDTSELVAQHLVQQGVSSLNVANRTLQRATELAQRVGAEAHSLSQLGELLPNADIVVSSTASTLPIIGKGRVEKALKQRRHKPILLIDLAVPRDIEEQVNELDDAYLYTVDDLQNIISENIKNREQAAQQARKIIAREANQFLDWLRSLDSVTLIRDYRQHTQKVAQLQLEKALAMLQQGKPAEQVMQVLSHKLTQQHAHRPTQLLKQAGEQGDQTTLSVLQRLWLEDDNQNKETN
ncbi:MAG: glutamyl-tRNA reductase [Idiomarinaceae bacterium]|nr:glutamyl-tRNA reductase [Idiomarinaceae bacterium]